MPSINTELGERALSKMQHEMDWKPLKERCMRQYTTWSSRHVDRILREYMRFIALKVATRDIYDTIVLAPVLIDAMWQQHVLSTQQYYADCQMLLQANQILHYNSDAVMTLSDSIRNKRMELTKASLCMMFSGMYPLSSDAKGIWDFEEGDGTAASQALEQSLATATLVACDTEETPTATTDLPYRREEEEEDDDEDTELLETPPPSPSPIKQQQQHRKKKSSKKATKKQAKKEDRTLRKFYIYRAGKVSKLQAYPYETISDVKQKIHRRDGISPQKQLLEWEELELEDHKTIAQYDIPNDSTIILTKMRNIGKQNHQRMQEQGLLVDSLDEEEEEEDGRDDVDVHEERDDPESPRHQRRGRSSSRGRQQQHQRPPLHPSYDPSSEVYHPAEDSYADHQHHQAMLNKMRIQSHNHNMDSSGVDHQHHRSSSRPKPPQPPAAPSVQIFINTIMGFTITLSAKTSDTVEHIKQLIEEQEDIPLSKQILVLEGMPLEDHQLLSTYTRESSSTTTPLALHVLLRLRGGSTTAASSVASTTIPSSTVPVVPMKKPNRLIIMNTNRGGGGGGGRGQQQQQPAPRSPPPKRQQPLTNRRPVWR